MKLSTQKNINVLLILNIIILCLSGCGERFKQNIAAPIIAYSHEKNSSHQIQKYHDKFKKTNIYFNKSNRYNKPSNQHKKTNNQHKKYHQYNKSNKTKFSFKNKRYKHRTKKEWVSPTYGSHYQKDLITYFDGKEKQTIRSSTNGTVIFSGMGRKPFKKMIIISKNPDLNTIYANLSEITVKEGDYIRQGQKIGKMGHNKNKWTLIFQIRKNGKPINSNLFIK
tara:strand:- start:1628 stop:2296 length:669 start_codon:yes stop_codon:yes gene_type:complete